MLVKQGAFINLLFKIFRFLAALAPLIWIYSRLNLPQFLDAAQKVAWWTIPAVALLTLLAMGLQGFRLLVLTRAFIQDLPIPAFFAAHMKSYFYSLVLPGAAAQDIVRATILSKDNQYQVIWAATWLAKLLGLIVLALYSLLGITLLGSEIFTSWIIKLAYAAFVVIIVLMIITFSKTSTRPLRSILSRLLPKRLLSLLESIRQSIYLYRGKPQTLAGVLLVTVIMQGVLILTSCFLIFGISDRFPLFACAAFIPLIELICTVIPITPNGIGLRETLVAIMFGYLGFTDEQLGLYVVIALATILIRLAGGIPVAIDAFRKSK